MAQQDLPDLQELTEWMVVMVLTVFLALTVAMVPMVLMDLRERLVMSDLWGIPDEMGRLGNQVLKENKVLLGLSMMEPRERPVSPVRMAYLDPLEQR